MVECLRKTYVLFRGHSQRRQNNQLNEPYFLAKAKRQAGDAPINTNHFLLFRIHCTCSWVKYLFGWILHETFTIHWNIHCHLCLRKI